MEMKKSVMEALNGISLSDAKETNAGQANASNITCLPPEIIHEILSHLECPGLLSLIRTCRSMRMHGENELLWANLIRESLPNRPRTASPCSTFRSLYLGHHPYWFLPKHVLWFSDNAHTGKLILVKFDRRRRLIEGYRLLGRKGDSIIEEWSYNPAVIIHSFEPKVTLHRDRPVLMLKHIDSTSETRRQGWWEGETRMKVGRYAHDNIFSTFFLSRAMPKQLQDPNMEMWPPKLIPAQERVRIASQDNFQGREHKPQKFEEISTTTFRLRTWMQFAAGGSAFGVRMGEEVATWSTLDPKLYTPTEEKPYQGIWVGDYAGHGCEFLLITQRNSVEDETYETRSGGWNRWNSDLPEDEIDMRVVMANTPQGGDNVQDDSKFQGRIEAIKLTGDVNVPRGEYSWIANDIGSAGFIRVADEAPFQGARIVKSRAHLAARGYQDGLCI
jgi:Cyclin D1 binding domain/F-box-like